MIIAIRYPTITELYEPDIRAFAQMTADGHVFMNGRRPDTTKKLVDDFKTLMTRLNGKPNEEQRSLIRSMIGASWNNYTRNYADRARLQNNFSVEIVDSVEEACHSEYRVLYIFTKADGRKYIIA